MVAAPALAQEQGSLFEARAAGQVGERFDGYLGAPQPVVGIVRTQLQTVNIRRRALFTDLATRKGVGAGDVGVTAGCTAGSASAPHSTRELGRTRARDDE